MAVPFKIDLCGRVAVVTGGGGVLCSQMARALAECGAKVAVLDLNLDAAKAGAAALRADGLIAEGFEANVLERDSLQAASEAVRAQFGPWRPARQRCRRQPPQGHHQQGMAQRNRPRG